MAANLFSNLDVAFSISWSFKVKMQCKFIQSTQTKKQVLLFSLFKLQITANSSKYLNVFENR